MGFRVILSPMRENNIFRVGFANDKSIVFVKADNSQHALEISKRLFPGLDACIACQISVYGEDGVLVL